MEKEDVQRYARQMTLAGFGAEAQRRISGGSVLVVGAGGLGSPALLYLAGAGVGRLGIADPDAVDAGNLHRQIAHSSGSVGENKARSAQRAAAALNPRVAVEAIAARVDARLAASLAQRYDVVVDATDSVEARYVLSDACVAARKPLVSGAALRADGQVAVYCHPPRVGPCYRCVHPAPPAPDAALRADAAGVLGPAVGAVGCWEALEALKLLAGVGDVLAGRMLVLGGLTCSARVVRLRGRQPACPACGDSPTIDAATFDYARFCGVRWTPSAEDNARTGVACADLAGELRAGAVAALVDVRSREEFSFARIDGTALNVPFSELADRIEEVKQLRIAGATAGDSKKLVFVCRRGADSQKAAEMLRSAGVEQAFHAIGGLIAWASEVDRNFPIY